MSLFYSAVISMNEIVDCSLCKVIGTTTCPSNGHFTKVSLDDVVVVPL